MLFFWSAALCIEYGYIHEHEYIHEYEYEFGWMDGLNFGMGVEPFVPIWRFTEVGGGGTERNGTERKVGGAYKYSGKGKGMRPSLLQGKVESCT